MERPLALVVDESADVRAQVRNALVGSGVEALGAATDGEGLEALRTRPVRVLLLSSASSSAERRGFLERATLLRPSIVTVVLVDRPSHAEESEAFRIGAFDLLSRPPDPERLRLVVDRALGLHDLLEERRRLGSQVGSRAACQRIVGRSDAAERLRKRLDGLAPGEERVLFTGEAGSGKKLAARLLHARSPGRDRPFAQVDCASKSEALEAELFGWEPGALRDRASRGAGVLESADGGTVLLNDVEALPLDLQDRLLATLLEGTVERVGGNERIPFHARVLAATRSDLKRLAAEDRFRDDLRRALAAETVALPALRERPEDVGLLAWHFVEEIRSINDLPPIRITPDALEALRRNAWPGNVRDLRDAIEHAVVLAVDGTIRPRDLPEAVRVAAEPGDGGESAAARFREAKRLVVESFEKRYLADLLARHRGNVTAAAQHAGMLRSALQRLLRKYDLRSSEFRGSGGDRTLD